MELPQAPGAQRQPCGALFLFRAAPLSCPGSPWEVTGHGRSVSAREPRAGHAPSRQCAGWWGVTWGARLLQPRLGFPRGLCWYTEERMETAPLEVCQVGKAVSVL